jgi:hypothetical protein
MNNLLRREITPEIKVLDEKGGIVEYVASDSSVDSYREVIRADGWRFNQFKKNPVFVNSHDYSDSANVFGRVVDMKIVGRSLVETVQWAIGVGHEKAEVAYNLTKAGFLKAVSVGFWPVKIVTKADAAYAAQMKELNIEAMTDVRTIFTEVEQIELSAVVIGANSNALACSIDSFARAYKDGVITEPQLKILSLEVACRETASVADQPAYATLARGLAQTAFLEKLNRAIGAQ